MRLVSWNCRSGGAAKWHALEHLKPDVAVLCEAPVVNPLPEPTLIGPVLAWAGVGSIASKGLAIGSATQALRVLDRRAGEGRWSVAVQPDVGPAVLGIWSCPERAIGDAYANEVIATLEAWSDVLAAGEMIVAGDFNVGYAVGGPTEHPRLAQVQACWEGLGLVSAYHAFAGEDFSAPAQATYFHRGHAAEGFHIDYVLVPQSRTAGLQGVRIGSYDTWIGKGRSDHAPIVVDMDWGASRRLA